MSRSGRTLGISVWLPAAGLAALYMMATYDITIQERGPGPRAAKLASSLPLGPWKATATVDARYARLAAEAMTASGADLLAVDRSLEAAERDFPSDYRFTYERATLAVYGRADHHEAFYHMRRAAEKSIGTQKTGEMLDRLKQDGEAKGRLRKLAVGHGEWSLLREALENQDRDRLWQAHGSHRRVPTAAPKSAPSGHGVDLTSRLKHETPCIDALAAQRQMPMDREAQNRYQRLRELCLRASEPGQPRASVRDSRHH